MAETFGARAAPGDDGSASDSRPGSSMSLHFRVLLLACTSLAALLGIGWIEHSTLQRLHRQTLDATLRTSRSEVLALNAQVTFKKQVQEWKNVLIRGHEAADRAKYWDSFLAEEARTRDLVGQLRGELPASSPARGTALKFLESHREMGERYRSSLAAFDRSGNLAYQESDVLVRGQDRKPTDLFDRIVAQLAKSREEEQARMEGELRTKILWLRTFGVVGVGLMFGAILWALSRWVSRQDRGRKFRGAGGGTHQHRIWQSPARAQPDGGAASSRLRHSGGRQRGS